MNITNLLKQTNSKTSKVNWRQYHKLSPDTYQAITKGIHQEVHKLLPDAHIDIDYSTKRPWDLYIQITNNEPWDTTQTLTIIIRQFALQDLDIVTYTMFEAYVQDGSYCQTMLPGHFYN